MKRLFCVGAILFSLALTFPRTAQAQLFISRTYDNDVLQYSLADGSSLGTFVTSGSGGLQDARTPLFGPDGNLYVSGATGVLRYDGLTGAFLNTFVAKTSGGLGAISMGITFGPDGNFYIADYANQVIRRYNGQTGGFLDTFTSGGNLVRPYEISFGKDGNLYVVDGGNLDPNDSNAGVKQFSGTTGAYLGKFVANGSGGLSVPLDMTFGPDGNLYVASELSNSVLRYDGTTGAFLNVAASGNGLSSPQSARFGPDGNLYVLGAKSGNDDTVLRFQGTTNTFIDTFVSTVSGKQGNSPYAITFKANVQSTPEPGALALAMVSAVFATGLLARRRKRSG